MSQHHPIELFLVALLGLAEGAWWLFRTVLVPAIVIAVVILGYSPTRVATPPSPPHVAITAPFTHQLAETADSLKQLTNRELMAMVGTKRKLTKTQLVAALVAC